MITRSNGRVVLKRVPQSRPAVPTDKDKEQAHIAVDMLVYCSCLMMMHGHLVESLIKEGKYRHRTKYQVKKFGDKSYQVYGECCRVFGGEDNQLCDEFGRRAGILFEKINKSVYFEGGSEKWYQIICSLSRIIEKRNRQLETSYYFRQAEYLYNADRKLDCLGYTSNDVVDSIILGLGRVECEIID